jgi:hypothetical protein
MCKIVIIEEQILQLKSSVIVILEGVSFLSSNRIILAEETNQNTNLT